MYSIKTDLGVLGGATIDKDLLLKGNAVFKQNLSVEGTVSFADATFTAITVTGSAQFADITSTGTSNLGNLNVSGNTVLGDALTDTVSVKGTLAVDAEATFNSNITQTTGSASFKETSADSLTVSGNAKVNGNLSTEPTSTVALGSTTTEALHAKGAAVLDSTLNVTGKTTLGDVEINGTLSGTYTMDAGTFNNIEVKTLSDLNNVNIKGATTIQGNVTGANSTVSVNQYRVSGQTGSVQFTYNDPLRPSDIKTSLEPYKVSTQEIDTNDIQTDVATVGVVGGGEDHGLHALGNAKIDYLKIAGNSTIGTADNFLEVTGKSVLQDTTVRNLTITGAVSGLSFTDLNVATLNVSGASTLAGVNMSGNLTGGNSSVARFSTFTVDDGTAGNHGIVQFAYNDTLRPNDTKSSIEPYKMATSDLVADKAVLKAAEVGDVAGTAGLKALGKATIDYLSITGNSTIGEATPKLEVTGDTVLQKTTVGDLIITGAVSGLSFTDINATSLNVSGPSTLQNLTLSGNLTGARTSIANFSTLNVIDGDSGNHGILQFAYNDSARPSDTKSSIEPYKIATSDLVADKALLQNASVGNVGGTAGLTALGKSTMDYVHIQGNSTIGTAQPQLKVDGKSILADVEFTGVVTGLTVDVSGQDLTPNSVVATAALNGNTLESVTTTTVGTDLSVGGNAAVTGNATVGGTLGVTGEITATAGATIGGNVTVNGQTVTVKDLVVTGTTTGVTAAANVDGLDIAPNSVVATAGVSAESVAATGAVTAASVTATGEVNGGSLNVTGASAIGAASAASLSVTGASTLASVTADSLVVPSITGNTTFANDVTISGVLTPASIDLSTTAVDAASVTTTGNVNVGGNLVVDGTFDLSAADINVKSITATVAQSTIPTLSSTTITAGTVNAGDIDATGDISAVSFAATGDVSAATATVPSIQGAAAGAGTVTLVSNAVAAKDLTVTGSFKPNGGIESIGDISATNITATGIVKGASVESATVQAAPLGAGTVTLASDVVAAKNLTVNGTFTPVGGFDLSSVDIASKSITTTEGATIGGNLAVSGTVDLSGADVTALSFVSTDAAKTNTFPKLASDEATLGAVTVSAASTLADVTASGTLAVTGETTLAGVTAGAIGASSVSATGAVSAASFTTAGTTVQLAKSTNVTGDFHATGTLTAGAIDLSTTDVTVKSLNSLGNAHVTGDLTVDGQFDLSATNLSALTLSSTNDTTVGGSLNVTGASTLADVTADALTTTGLATLNGAKVNTTLEVTGVSTLGTVNANAASVTTTLGVSGNTSLSTVSTSGLATLNSADIGTTLNVTGASTLADVTAGATSVSTLSTSGKATLASLDITGNTVATGDMTVNGTFTPAGGLNLAGADLSVNSVSTAAGATVGTTLGVTGDTTVGGTLTSTGAGKFGSVTSDNGLTVTTGATTLGGAITASGAGKFGSVTSDNGATITTGDLTVTAGNIAQNGAATATASFKKTSTTNLHVGTLVWDEEEYIAEISGNTHITGNLDVDGTITAQIDLTGRDISPRSVTTSQAVSVGTTLEVKGQATIDSAVIGASGSVNNNLQLNGNAVCTGDFTVNGRIIGTLDQSTSDLVAQSVTSTSFLKGVTLEVTGAATVGTTLTTGGKLTVSADGAAITGATTVTGTLSSTGTATFSAAASVGTTLTTGGKLTVSADGAAITGGLETDTLTVTGTSTLAAVTTGAITATSLTVSGTSDFTGKVTAVDIDSTGTINANNLTVTGTLTADIGDLVTESVSTSKYLVKAAPAASATGTWTPDGTSNVYNITLTGDTTVGNLPITPGYAGSWFVYVTQDATGNHSLTLPPPYSVIGTDTAINTTPNSVSICQLVYSGVGSTIDVFIAQRNV